MSLKPEFSYEITNTQVTDSGEGRVIVSLKYILPKEDEDNMVDNVIEIAIFNFGVGANDPAEADVEDLLRTAVPQYFLPQANT